MGCGQAQCRRLQDAAQLEFLAQRARRQRAGDPVGTGVLANQPAFLQPRHHVAHDSAADTQVFGKLGFNDPELAEDLALGDLLFHMVVDMKPRAPGLKRIVHVPGDIKLQVTDIMADRSNGLLPVAHKIAATVEAVDQPFIQKLAQG